MMKTILILALIGLTFGQRFQSARDNRIRQHFRPSSQRRFQAQPAAALIQPQSQLQFDQFQTQVRVPQVHVAQFQPQVRVPQVHVQPQRVSPIRRPFIGLLRSNSEGPYADGSYFFDFASEDGITRSETGGNAGIDPRTGYLIHTKSGSYSYTSPEGIPIEVTYEADHNGYRASTSNLPIGPPPPPHAVQQILAAQRAFASRGQVFRSGFDNHPELSG